MITRYTEPADLVREFFKDWERAKYWQKKMTDRANTSSKLFKNYEAAYFSYDKDLRSDVIEYESPLYGNKWLLWWRFRSNGYCTHPMTSAYQVCYQMTSASMNIMAPTTLSCEEGEVRGVSMFTDHLFLRMADKDRLGLNLSDRKLVIRNFVEQIIEQSILDIRGPRPGDENDQVICRLPASWLRGHIIYVGENYLCRFNTFYTDMNLTSKQKKYLQSFAKFADAFTTKGEIREYFKADV